MKDDEATNVFKAGKIAGRFLRIIDEVEHVLVINPETHNIITTSNPAITNTPGEKSDPIELYKWDDGTSRFYIGYSAKQKAIILAFPEEL